MVNSSSLLSLILSRRESGARTLRLRALADDETIVSRETSIFWMGILIMTAWLLFVVYLTQDVLRGKQRTTPSVSIPPGPQCSCVA